MAAKVFDFLSIVKTAFAQGGPIGQSFTLPNPLANLRCTSGATGFACVVEKLADFLIIIGGPLVGIMVLIGGFYMVTAAGNPEKFSTGKKTILYAAVGFVVILLAKGVAAAIQGIFR